MLMNKRTFSSHCHKYQMPSLRLRNSCCASPSYRSCAALFAEHRRDTVMTKQRGRECYKGMEKHAKLSGTCNRKGIPRMCGNRYPGSPEFVRETVPELYFSFPGRFHPLSSGAYIHTIDIHAVVFIYYIVCRVVDTRWL